MERTQTATGQFNTSWAAVLTDIPARYVPQSGGQNYEGEQRVSNTLVVFHIRYNNDVKQGYQLIYEGVKYNIASVIEIGRRVALELRAERKDN
jgi:SPP1 family predicted phage head-tail adaptor